MPDWVGVTLLIASLLLISISLTSKGTYDEKSQWAFAGMWVALAGIIVAVFFTN